ncbi:PRC-barrel domain-containing protein [Labrys monachus]|uniref:Sporulation protein YlmC with PRC-barrel domain n=1 Tax=Labrys monachus TaxID=217067 RepID=A0ABU0F844_9HYPH|nr:PRC-barrel domain-containing protein [Labrys monachus]MDQ0390225.1 sporulation protein YlmC with PRC-barrel domain [Labrys monachus]
MLIEAASMGPSPLVPARERTGAPAPGRWLAACLALFVLALFVLAAPGNGLAQDAPAVQPAHDGGTAAVPAPGPPPQKVPGTDKPAQAAPAPPAAAQPAPAPQAAPAQGTPVQGTPAQETPAKGTPAKGSEPQAPGTETPAVVIDESAADTLLGKSVQSTNGDDMGRIIDVVVDRSGMVRAAIIDFGGFLGIGTREIAVDWRLLHFAKDGNMQTIVTDLTRNQLRTAPVYKQGEPIIVVGRADAPAAPPPQPAAPAQPAAPQPAAQAPPAQPPAAAAPAAQAPAVQAPAAPPAVPPAPAAPTPEGVPAQKQKP